MTLVGKCRRILMGEVLQVLHLGMVQHLVWMVIHRGCHLSCSALLAHLLDRVDLIRSLPLIELVLQLFN